MQEIIDQANIGRSTFYAHFGTKDDLLSELCADMFRHVFSEHLETELTHDFSSSDHALKEKITHILYHLKDNQTEMIRLLSGESGELFLNYFKNNLVEMFEGVIQHTGLELPAWGDVRVKFCFVNVGLDYERTYILCQPHWSGHTEVEQG